MSRGNVEPTVKEMNKMVRRSSVLVLNAITAGVKRKRRAWKADAELPVKSFAFDDICNKYFGDRRFKMIKNSPWLFKADAHWFLKKHARCHMSGRFIFNTSSKGRHQAFLVPGEPPCQGFMICGREETVEAPQVYEWDGCLVFMDWPVDNSICDFFVCPSESINEKLNEFNDLYIRNTIIKGKYCEVWYDNNGLNFNILSVESKDVLFLEEDELKMRKIKRVIDNWDKLDNSERKMGVLLYGPPGTGKTASLSKLAFELSGKATIINLKGGPHEPV